MIEKHEQHGFTLVEIMFAMSILALVMTGIMTFLVDSVRTTFITEQKLNINGDIRDVTNKLADEAREANYFTLYTSFYPQYEVEPMGDFREPATGYAAADYRQRRGNSGDFLLLVYTGIDPNPDDLEPAPIEKIIGYFRDGGTVDSEQAPVRRFEVEVPKADQYEELETLIPSSTLSILHPEVINLVTGLADGNLFYNIQNRSVLVNGKIIHGNDAKQVTGTYNFTVSPRG